MMDTIKQNHEIGVRYMHTIEREQAIRNEGKAEGKAEGKIEGELATQIKYICNQHKKEIPMEDAACILDEDIELVSEIYAIADRYAPDYDINSILEEYMCITHS